MKRHLFVCALLALAACAPEGMQRPKPVPQTGVPATALPQQPAAVPQASATVKVALLLPLSADSSGLGSAMLDAAMLAIYDKYVSLPPEQIHTRVVLVPADTGSNPKEAEAAAKAAIDQGAQLILGPIFGPEAQAVAGVARARNVPVITFSNNRAIAGWPVFAFGYLPDQQVARMAEFGFAHRVQRIGVLAPNDAYGQSVAQAVTSSYRLKSGIVQPVEMYAGREGNLDAAAQRLKAAYTAAPYDGLFIADGADRMSAILPALKKAGIERGKIKLLGMGVWDDPLVLKQPDMQGAWFATGPPQYYQWFERRFQATYGYKPKRIASLAYDAVALAIALANGPGPINQQALTNPNGFEGPANGLFRLLPDGTSERGLAVMEVGPEGFKVIDAAPLAFTTTAKP